MRVKSKPSKFRMYWDMNIPTQYYEQDFLLFEKDFNMESIGSSTCPNTEAPEIVLQEFAKFEKKMKRDLKRYPHETAVMHTDAIKVTKSEIPQCAHVQSGQEKENLPIPNDKAANDIQVRLNYNEWSHINYVLNAGGTQRRIYSYGCYEVSKCMKGIQKD